MEQVKISYSEIRNKVARPATAQQKVAAKAILLNLRNYIIQALSN